MYRPSRAVAPASSRYAADYGMPTWRPTQIQSYIDRCCDTAMEQLNLPLALELADYINTKRANTAREAAFEIVQRINARVPHVGMLAHPCKKLWLFDAFADRDERVSERAGAPIPGTTSDAPRTCNDANPRDDSRVATDYLRHEQA